MEMLNGGSWFSRNLEYVVGAVVTPFNPPLGITILITTAASRNLENF